jgi:D-glycero-D-manno-heptose 1,7-bisphosphate phosphatase
LILKAAQDLEIDLANSFLVGDRWKDISAGQHAGCTSFFINNNYSERQPEMPYIAVSSLKEATSIILESYE